jgi:hypothetical protein
VPNIVRDESFFFPETAVAVAEARWRFRPGTAGRALGSRREDKDEEEKEEEKEEGDEENEEEEE